MEPAEVQQAVTKALVISLALAAGVALYTAVAYYIRISGTLEPPLDLGEPVFLGIAAAGFLLIIAADRAGALLGGGVPLASSTDAARRFITAAIAAQAAREGVGIGGVTLGMIGGSATWILVFGIGTVAAMLLSLPKRSQLESLLDEVEAEGD